VNFPIVIDVEEERAHIRVEILKVHWREGANSSTGHCAWYTSSETFQCIAFHCHFREYVQCCKLFMCHSCLYDKNTISQSLRHYTSKQQTKTKKIKITKWIAGCNSTKKNHVPISNNLKQEINFWTASSKCNLPCTGKQCSSPAVCIFRRYISCANNTLLL